MDMLTRKETEHIQEAVCQTLCCSLTDNTRKRQQVDARKLATWFLLKRGLTLEAVGAIIRKDHSTVCYYRKSIDGLIEIGDRLTKERIDQINRKIKELHSKNEIAMKKKIYISGAIAHHDLQERKKTFDMAEHYLDLKGYEPVNPFNNGLPADAHWRDHMRADIALLLQCDCIFMLQGWELSKGAKLELDVASSCGIEVLFEYAKPL